MRGCALRKVVRNLAHKKLENRGVDPQHLPSQIHLPGTRGQAPWRCRRRMRAEVLCRQRLPSADTSSSLLTFTPSAE